MELPTWAAEFAADAGHVAAEVVRPALLQLTWLARSGAPIARVGTPSACGDGLALAPDAGRLLVTRLNDRGSSDIWLIDLETAAERAVTSLRQATSPLWAAGAHSFAFRALTGQGGNGTVYEQPLSGAAPRQLVSGLYSAYPAGWANASRRFVWTGQDSASRGGVFFTEGARTDHNYGIPDTQIGRGRVSPDGTLLAYASGQTGLTEVSIMDLRYPGIPAVPASRGGGIEPRWRADGRELYFLSNGGLYASSVSLGPALRVTSPRRLFTTTAEEYDVHPSGERFLVELPVSREEQYVRVLRHWAGRMLNDTASVAAHRN